MDRVLVTSHLAAAEGHVTKGELLLTRQRDLITELQRAGWDTSIAQDTLNSFERAQALLVADRDRLRGLLDQEAHPAILRA